MIINMGYGDSGILMANLSMNHGYYNNIEHGIWKEFQDDGTFSVEGRYLHGQKHGQWKCWPDIMNGYEQEEGEYVNGKKQGVWKTVCEQSGEQWIQDYVDDIKYGNYTHFDGDSDLVTKGEYRDDKKYGLWKDWGSVFKL
jgi:antitoxin component YwqK of YwqJK toxin-antitoxin module